MAKRPAKVQISLGICPVLSVFAVRMKKAWVTSYPLSAQGRLCEQTGRMPRLMSLRWTHSHFVLSCCGSNGKSLKSTKYTKHSQHKTFTIQNAVLVFLMEENFKYLSKETVFFFFFFFFFASLFKSSPKDPLMWQLSCTVYLESMPTWCFRYFQKTESPFHKSLVVKKLM